MTHALPLSFRSLVLSVILAPVISLAQKEAWTSQVDGAVQWLRTTSAGALVACTPQGLTGIDPANGSIAWTVKELANAPESGYEEIANTPFIAVVPAGAPDDLFIVEPFGGQVVFNSRSAGIQRIASRYFLYANNAIVLVGQRADKSAVMACVDMGTGQVRWTKDDAFSKLTACTSAGPDAIVLATLFFAYKLDANTGAELWKQSPDPKFASMSGLMGMLDKGGANLDASMQPVGVFLTTPHAPELCIMGLQQTKRSEKTDAAGKTTTTISYSSFYNAFNLSDGSYAWEKPVQVAQKLGTIVPLSRGLLIGNGDNNQVDLLSYKSGAGVWGKNGRGITVKGPLSGAVEVGERTLLTSGGSDMAAMLVDAAGTDLWKKPIKLDGAAASVMLLGNAVILASAEEAEVADMATGVSLLGGTYKGGASLVARDDGDAYLFNTKTGQLARLAAGANSAAILNTVPLAFEGKEKATALEVLPEGIVVRSDQNIALITREGTVKYQKYFPAPRESGLVRALKYASAVRAAYYTAAFGYTSAAFGAVSQQIQVQDAGSAAAKDITRAVSDVYGEASRMGLSATKRFMQEANARFKATANTNALQFMLTGEKGVYQLQAVNKADGGLAGSVPLGNTKTPLYEVDGFTNTVYLAQGSAVKAFMH
ncbi:MAG: PQQ-binding-like beta-propeller repeat protein [Flavobacteriales bacterium]|nr:PQQ-binding-like beta-propeller repeat protein [Flavobacteriales bacterium]